MSARKKNKETIVPAEQKIISAARRLFTQKGYDAVKTRDIAKEAGINLALLNYYFGSKEKLFEQVMQENMIQFFTSISLLINDKKTGMKEKIHALVNKYIDMLTENPELPLFVMTHMKNDRHRKKFKGRMSNSYLLKQVEQAVKRGEIAPIQPVNFIINIVGLTIFPFISRHMLQAANGISDKQFMSMMEERREYIPRWIDAILEVK